MVLDLSLRIKINNGTHFDCKFENICENKYVSELVNKVKHVRDIEAEN